VPMARLSTGRLRLKPRNCTPGQWRYDQDWTDHVTVVMEHFQRHRALLDLNDMKE
jgi:hypothetical protein